MPEFILLRVSYLLIFIHILVRKWCFGAITLSAGKGPLPRAELPGGHSQVSETLLPGSLGTRTSHRHQHWPQPQCYPGVAGCAVLASGWGAVPPAYPPGYDRVCRPTCSSAATESSKECSPRVCSMMPQLGVPAHSQATPPTHCT